MISFPFPALLDLSVSTLFQSSCNYIFLLFIRTWRTRCCCSCSWLRTWSWCLCRQWLQHQSQWSYIIKSVTAWHQTPQVCYCLRARASNCSTK